MPWWRRALKSVAIVAASVLVLGILSTAANAILSASEKTSLAPYGQKMTIGAGGINVYRNGGTGPTMVLLSGYGTSAPAVDFAPLIRELDAFDVIVIEGFGYGYSDMDVRDRTIENITSEIHEVLGRLGVHSPVILAGHSIGGIYTRYYANAYPGEVSAIIGIDPTPAKTSTLAIGDPSTLGGTLTSLGLVRVANTLAPSLIEPDGTSFTKKERERIVAMANWNFGDISVSDEWSRLASNSTKANAHPFPADIPVLDFLSTASNKSIPGWLANHQAELADVTTHQLDIIKGGHYLHWTQAPLMARTISDFITANVKH